MFNPFKHKPKKIKLAPDSDPADINNWLLEPDVLTDEMKRWNKRVEEQEVKSSGKTE